MEILWKGKYQQFVDAITLFSNSYADNWQKKLYTIDDECFSTAEMQILAQILENDEKQMKMTDICRSIDMPKSTFSRHAANLEKLGLVEKVHPEDNRKDIIILTTEKGKAVYMKYSEYIYNNVFRPVFELLDYVPQEHISALTQALHFWRDKATMDVKSKGSSDGKREQKMKI